MAVVVTFDGPNKLININTGITTIDAQNVYSTWKLRVQDGTLTQFLPAFSVVGGDPISAGISITPYYFMINGWKIKPSASNQTLTITGNLLTDDSSSPISFAGLSAFQIDVVRQLALKTETVATGGSTGPTAAQIAAAVWDELVAAHVADGTAGKLLQAIKNDTALVPGLI